MELFANTSFPIVKFLTFLDRMSDSIFDSLKANLSITNSVTLSGTINDFIPEPQKALLPIFKVLQLEFDKKLNVLSF